MDNKKIVAAVGVAAGVAALLLHRRRVKADEEVEGGAAINIRVLDSNGNEVPHNSPILLDPGEYTVEVTVTNQSRYLGEPAEASLTTKIQAAINGIELIAPDTRMSNYDPNQAKAMSWPMVVPFDTPVGAGAILVSVHDPDDGKLAEDSQEIETTGPRRPAINGMGDLNDDGFVSKEDVAILQEYVEQLSNYLWDRLVIPEASPLPYWEFIRRADMNCDFKFDEEDIQAMHTFMETGVLPERVLPQREAINGMGDLNDDGYVDNVDMNIMAFALHAQGDPEWDPQGVATPLPREEFLRRADMNADGVVDIRDLLSMNRFLHYGEYDVHAYVDMNLGIKEGVTDLEPGEAYTVQAEVTNRSRSAGAPSAADLTTVIEAMVNNTPLIPETSIPRHFEAEQTILLEAPFEVPFGIPVSAGEIVAAVWSFMVSPETGLKIEEVRLPITISAPRRPAINGMGDLNDDGFVSVEDHDILQAYIHDSMSFRTGARPLSDITPANIPLYEFVRRADLNCDMKIDIKDIYSILQFIHEGTLPEPETPSRAAPHNGMGDLNDDGYLGPMDLLILREAGIFELPLALWSPLSEAEFLRRADMNGDGVIDTADWAHIWHWIAHGDVPVTYAAGLDMGVS